MSETKICGNCLWYQHEDISRGYVCVNSESEYFAEWMESNEHCDKWEGDHERAVSVPGKAD